MAKKKHKKTTRIITRIIDIISIIILAIFLYLIYKFNVVPAKYYWPIFGTLVSLDLLYTFLAFNKRIKTKILIFFDIFAIIFIIVEAFASLKINETLTFLNKNLDTKYKNDIYYVVVNKESPYETKEDIKGKTVYYYKDTDNYKKLENELNKKVKTNIKLIDAYSDLLKVKTDINYIELVNNGSYDSLKENDEEYENKTKILFKINLKTKVKQEETTNKNLTKQSTIIYLSGIDTRSNSIPSRSLSDVNMYIVINPKTHKILMVTVPRDYYVQVHGTKGLKDKLTHAGAIGGVDLSKATMQDLLGYKADYYFRINFNSVVRLVDAIGGITVYNDQNRTFSCWTDRGCIFKPGNNNVNGRCALAFVRERHAYQSGDRHRGENQQQVIQKVFEKVTSSKSLLTNYSNILNALNGTFETDMSTDDITSLIQYQIDKMPSWQMDSYSLDGTTGGAFTHSYPNQQLSVMYPKEETIEEAKAKIKEVYNEE